MLNAIIPSYVSFSQLGIIFSFTSLRIGLLKRAYKHVRYMSDQNDVTLNLRSVLTSQAPVYVVLDGAKFDNLPELLFDNDFAYKPLYRDMGSELRDIERTTPQFVRFDKWDYWENNLTAEQRLERLLDVVDDLSAAVFWAYDGEPKTLFKHLRTINNIMIPRDADTPPMPDPLDPDGETFGNTTTHQQVLFRHADADVMAQVLPCLSDPQITRIMGPADGVIFAPDPEWASGEDIMTVTNPKDTYNSTHPLKLTNPDMDRIEKKRAEVLRRDVMVFLKGILPEETQNLDEKKLYQQVLLCEQTADAANISTPDGYKIWAYLALKTKGQSIKSPIPAEYLKYKLTPDDALIGLVDNIIDMDPICLEELFSD